MGGVGYQIIHCHSQICVIHFVSLCNFHSLDPSKHKSSTITRAVYGVSVDPLCEHRLASFFEEQTYIWDLRHFEKPVSFGELDRVV